MSGYVPIDAGDTTPDTAPQGAAKINSGFARLLGSKITCTPSPSSAGAPTNNYDPTGDLSLATVSRIDLDLTGDTYFAGFDSTAVPDEHTLRLRNPSAFQATFGHLKASSLSANRFFCPGLDDFAIPPGSTVTIQRWANSDNVWVIEG